MLTEYIRIAMKHAQSEWLPEDKTYYCKIPDLPGVWASAETEEVAITELQEALEEWIALGLSMHRPVSEAEVLASG